MTIAPKSIKALLKVQQLHKSLESELAEQQAVADASLDEALNRADTAEPEMIEALQERNDIAEARMDIAAVSEDAAQLEQTADDLEATIPDGGAEPLDMELAEVAIERICTNLGIERIKTPSVEAFASGKTRLRATQATVESLREVAGKAMDSVKAALGKLKEKTGTLLNKVLGTMKHQAGRADELAKAAQALASQGAGEGQFKSVMLTADAGKIAALLTEAKASPAELSRLVGVLSNANQAILNGSPAVAAFAPKGADIGDGMRNFYKGMMNGEMGVSAFGALKGDDALQALIAMDMSEQAGAPQQLPLLAPKEAAKLAVLVKALIESHVSTQGQLYDRADDLFEVSSKSADSGHSADNLAKRESYKAISNSSYTGSDLIVNVYSYNSSLVKNVLDYCQASLKAAQAAAKKAE